MENKKPYFELSRKIAIWQYKRCKEIANIVSYSSKTNPEITPLLESETDSFFNIHTVEELKRVKDRKRVYFLAQALDKEALDTIFSAGVNKIIVDNEVDLKVLIEYIKQNDITVELLLRAKLKENSIRTERYFVFGMPTETINKKIRELKENKLIKQLGIHFHRKTQNLAEWNLIYEVKSMFSDETLDLIDVIDIGGGLPSEYANTNIDAFGNIYKKIKELKEFLNSKKIKLMIEPGRFISAPSVRLVTHIKLVYENNIIIDASVYNSDTDAFTVPVKLKIEGEVDKGKGNAYVIKGSTPCSMDIFRYRAYLNNPKVGEKIIFLNAGAYNFNCDFCDLEKLETKIVE